MPNPSLSKIKLNGVEYELKDTVARQGLDNIYIVNVTITSLSEETFTSDKTHTEILNAVNAGKVPFVKTSFGGLNMLAPLTHIDSEHAIFTYINQLDEYILIRYAQIKITDNIAEIQTLNDSFALSATIPTHTSELTNNSGFITSESDPIFSNSAAASITSNDIANWNNILTSSYVNSVNGKTGTVMLTAPDFDDSFKDALLNCFANVAWTTENGQQYYNALETVLYPPADLLSISAVFEQGETVIYDTDSLDTLKSILTVTANYDNDTSKTVTGYTLSGTLTEGTSTITVSYGGKIATFDAIVTHTIQNLFDPANDPNVNMIISTTDLKFRDQTSAQYSYASSYISVLPNQTYTITKMPTNQFHVGTSKNIPAHNGAVLQTEANHTGSSITITTGATANYLFFTYWYNVGDYDEQEIRNSIFIERVM